MTTRAPDPTIVDLRVYPVKSCGGIVFERWSVDAFGLEHDRRWMVVDEHGEFLTQRSHPRMALVRTALEGDVLELTAPALAPLRLPLVPDGRKARVRVWYDGTTAVDAGDEAAAWFSSHLGFACRLVWMGPADRRPVHPDYDPFGARVSFADAFPFLLISAASLDELNRRLAEPLPMNRFRPNIVVDGTGPHAEDGWRRIRIGGIDFAVVKPCARCAVTTTDQRTAERGKEPLRTLAGYRRSGGLVLFGQNLVHAGTGVLAAGDVVEIVERGEPAIPPPPPARASAAPSAPGP